jgi:hypothetical protein
MKHIKQFKHRKYSSTGIAIFWILIETFELIGFAVGFYAIANTPVANMRSDVKHLDEPAILREEINLLVESTIGGRQMAFVSLGLIIAAFILRTIVSRVIKMPSS